MQKDKSFHILSYIPLLFVLSLFMADKSSPAVRFHCGQGMILTIFSLICGIFSAAVGFIIGWVPIIGLLIAWLVSTVLGICVFILMVIGIVNASKDSEEPLPFIGKYAFYR